MDTEHIDFVDITTGLITVCVIAANIAVTPLVVLPAVGIWSIFAVWRRSVNYGRIIDKAAQNNKYLDSAVPLLLPPNSKMYQPEAPSPVQQRQLTSGTKLSYKDKFAAQQGQQTLITPATVQSGKSVGTTSRMAALGTLPQTETRRTPEQNMMYALSRMPKMIMYNNPKIPDPPTPMSVLVGYSPIEQRWIWADFEKDTIHTYIGGQTRAGKDTMIRMWFTQLTMNNTPEQLQFIVIDGKGEWTSPALMTSAHMAIPPVGGFKVQIETDERGKRRMRDLANESIEDTLVETIDMLQKRMEAFNKVGALNLQAYYHITGIKLPLLMLIVTDVSTNLQGLLEQLINFLLTKGGSIGVRAIISMQTSSGQDTTWRGQMGMAISGYQSQASADMPNLGIAVRAMKYRPSQLPSPDIPANRGLFVVRKGIHQYLVRGAYLPDDVFMSYCASQLPKIQEALNQATTDSLLSSLLSIDTQQQQQKVVVKPVVKQVLSKEKVQQAVEMAKAGIAPSNITKALGFTSNDRYAEAMPIVSGIVQTVKAAQQRNKGKV